MWQLQEGKQRFSELIRSAHTDGPQIVTKHGREVAVVLDIEEYRRLKGSARDFRDFLKAAPDVGLDIERSSVAAPVIEL